jgi:hypothetical protein
MTQRRRIQSSALQPNITLTRALTDPAWFGDVFAAPSFWTWRVVAKLIDGIPLTEQRELDLFHACTGRQRLPDKPVRRLYIYAGRRAGKDRFLSATGAWRCICTDWKQHHSAGEGAVALLLGADNKQARILHKYAAGLTASTGMARELIRLTRDTIAFRNGSSLEPSSNDARLVRGRSAIAVLGSEVAHWRTEDHAATGSDEEVISAALPSLAMCPDGGLVVLASSVHRKAGLMFRKYRELFGTDAADDVCWFAPSTVMNPQLPQYIIDAALAEDASKAKAEYLNVFREDLSDFIPADIVDAATDFGVHERAPHTRTQYFGYVDSASGIGSDSFALAVAHKAQDGLVQLDVVRERRPRFVPAQIISEYAALLKTYNISEVSGDKYSGAFNSEEWRRNGITYKSDAYSSASDLYLALLPALLANRVRLLDNKTLLLQFASLERRIGINNREFIGPPVSAGLRDDLSNAVAGALVGVLNRASFNWTAMADVPESAPALPVRLHPNLSDGDFLRYRRIPALIPREFLEEIQT